MKKPKDKSIKKNAELEARELKTISFVHAIRNARVTLLKLGSCDGIQNTIRKIGVN